MARLITSGAECQQVAPASLTNDAEGAGFQDNGPPTINTTTPRSGAACWQLDAINEAVTALISTVAGRAYFATGWYRPTANPTAAVNIMVPWHGGGSIGTITVETDGTLVLRDANDTPIGSPSAALTLGAYNRIDLKWIVPAAGAGTLEGRLAESVFATSSSADVNNTQPTVLDFAGFTTAPGTTFLLDDVCLNDDQGANENTYAGNEKYVLLKPTADSAIGVQWQGPQTSGTDTTNIFDCVDNTPPLGVAHSDVDANANKYIFCPTSGAAINYDATMQTYTAAGIGASDTITLVQALVRTGSSSATDTAGAVDLLSNPDAGAETSFAAFDSGIAGTESTNWKTTRNTIVYAPSVTLGTAPVLRVGKRTATTRVAMVDLMGIYVAYVPGVATEIPEVVMAAPRV